MSKLYDVCAIGNALVDYEIEVEDQFFTENGVEKGLMTLVDEDRQGALLQEVDGKIKKNFNGLIWDAIQKIKRSDLTNSGSRMPGTWTSLAPTSFSNGPQGYNGGLGRVNVVAFHPTDANTIYIGTPAGGLWKTTDGGTTWMPMSDELASIGVSGIAVDHSNPNKVYILTGDGDGGDTYSVRMYTVFGLE